MRYNTSLICSFSAEVRWIITHKWSCILCFCLKTRYYLNQFAWSLQQSFSKEFTDCCLFCFFHMSILVFILCSLLLSKCEQNFETRVHNYKAALLLCSSRRAYVFIKVEYANLHYGYRFYYKEGYTLRSAVKKNKLLCMCYSFNEILSCS